MNKVSPVYCLHSAHWEVVSGVEAQCGVQGPQELSYPCVFIKQAPLVNHWRSSEGLFLVLKSFASATQQPGRAEPDQLNPTRPRTGPDRPGRHDKAELIGG